MQKENSRAKKKVLQVTMSNKNQCICESF